MHIFKWNGWGGRAVMACLMIGLAGTAGWLVRPAQAELGFEVEQASAEAEAGGAAQVTVRCVALECYSDSGDESVSAEVEFIRDWLVAREGVSVKLRDVSTGVAERERLQKVRTAYRVEESRWPVVYGLNGVVAGPLSLERWEAELTQLLTMQVFVRPGCSRCAQAKDYLPQFQDRYPGLEVEFLDATEDPSASTRYQELARKQRIGGISFPGFWLCGQLVVGFESAAATGGRLERVLQRWTYDCELTKKIGSRGAVPAEHGRAGVDPLMLMGATTWGGVSRPVAWRRRSQPRQAVDRQVPDLPVGGEEPMWDDLPVGELEAETGVPAVDEVEVPWMGRIRASRLGMPIFTFLIGLIDGFNPCAMWVLLFLLSILVNLRDRWKIFAVAGTFVLVSGLAYFAFMAAWLNMLLFVGYLRWVQVLLAGLAIFVGVIHVKDFFAFKRGLSLSIPDSAKPGLYARVRGIVMAEHLYGAILGAMILAVLVNFIELLCTAGLPAMYTQVLMLQGYPTWKNYAYLALYILAYMLDDAIMVGIVIWTLGKRKLQEQEGRWLKLLSGVVVLALGVVLLLRPEWLS